MTSHIFLAMGMWPETIRANVVAIADVDRMRAAHKKELIRCGHYPAWLGYAYLQLGKVSEAGNALTACRATLESPSAMDHSHMTMDSDSTMSSAFANMRLRYLIDTGDWKGEAAGWSLPQAAGPGARLDFAFARVLGELGRGQVAAARQALNELEAASRDVVDFETKSANPDPSYRVRPGIFLLEARALLAEHDGDLAGAEKLLRQAVSLEATLPTAFGPPLIDKPTDELLGEFLLRRNRKDEARAEFKKALARMPGRRLSEQGLAATSTGVALRQSP
jgi:tetratricopeptide (TPR) repeat protein